MWMIIFLLLPMLGLVYVCWHVWCLLPLGWIWKTLVMACMTGIFMLLPASIMRFTDRLPMPLAIGVYEVGTSGIIVLLYLFMAFMLLDLGRLMHIVPKYYLYNNPWTAYGIVLLLSAIFVAGNASYQYKRRVNLYMVNKKLSKPVRLVLLSDLHLGYHNRGDELRRWVKKVNDEMPDVVLIAGDIIDGSMRPLQEEQMSEVFRLLKAPVYACMGNHEYYSGEPLAQQFYRDAGICLLQDSCVVTGDLCIIGRDDRSNRHRASLGKLMKQADRTKYCILLDHQPYHLEQAEREKIDFQFSGHTHYGQVWPISWFTRKLYECAYGSYQRGETHYYVSSGMGIWGGKYRIGTQSEYVVVDIGPKTQ